MIYLTKSSAYLTKSSAYLTKSSAYSEKSSAYFYARYIVVESLIEKLHSMDFSDEERQHLAALVDSTLHSTILDEILSHLKTEDKKLFLVKLQEDPESEKLIEFLQRRIDKVEEKIKKVSDELIQEMHEDIKKAKKIKSTKF